MVQVDSIANQRGMGSPGESLTGSEWGASTDFLEKTVELLHVVESGICPLATGMLKSLFDIFQ